jgi:hypothetical protein
MRDPDWRGVEKTLPATADRAHVRAKLEQIARAKSSPRLQAVQCDKIAGFCDDLGRELVKIATEIDLSGLSSSEAELIERLSWRRDAAKKQAAVYRRIKRPHFLTPRKRPPHGPVITYFQTAAKVVFGKAPTPGQTKKIVIKYRHLNFSAAQMSPQGGMPIDDSKVLILRDGKLMTQAEADEDARHR